MGMSHCIAETIFGFSIHTEHDLIIGQQKIIATGTSNIIVQNEISCWIN